MEKANLFNMIKANVIEYPRSKMVLLILMLLAQHSVLCQNKDTIEFTELSKILHQQFSQEFAFSVLIEIDNIETFYENFGHTDKKGLFPVNEKTLFNIASITKSVTAVGLMKLVEQNKINIEDTLGQFFENVPKNMESIRINTLLTHKSGFEQNYPVEGIVNSHDALVTILNGKLSFAPESEFRYSNQNYQLLALIIEEVTQNKFEDFIRKEVLIPLGMTNTYFWDEVNDKHDIANPSKKISKKIGTRNWSWIAATGIFSTARDLSRFWNGIYNDNFLSQESIDIIFNSYYETTSGLQIGYGFYKTPKTKWNTPELWTRGTESWGHNSVIRFFPEKNTTIIVSTNSGEFGKNKMTGNKVISDLIADYLFK